MSVTKNSADMEKSYNEKGDTWPKILKYNYEKYGASRRAMRAKHHGIWQPYTWKDYYIQAKTLALGLLSLGFAPGDKLLIIGDNAPQWYYAELAAQANHGVSVGLYSDLTPQEIKRIAENSEAGFAMVEDQEQVDKILQIRDELPLLKRIIYWNYKGLAHYHDPLLMDYRQVLQRGEVYEREHPGLFEQNVDSGKTDDICALVYTSGTAGPVPMGAVHTYKTMKTGAEYLLQLDPWDEDDTLVPSLPPTWMTEQWLGIGCHLLSASILNFAEAPETQHRDMKETGPSIVSYGARLWESQAAMVHAQMFDADAMKRHAFRMLMPIGYRMTEAKYRKQKPGLFLKLSYALADALLFRPIRRSLGLSNARICYTSGATLSPDAFKFYHALNLPLKNLYGTTEGGALAGSVNDDFRPDTVGPVHKEAEIRITDHGELVYRQPGTFLGYYKDPEKTAEVLRDGWFHSGDGGFLREDGHLVFKDRLKDLVKLASGDQLTPQSIESRLRFSPHIRDAWVLAGPRGDYASAVIVIDKVRVGKWAGQRRVSYTTFADLSQKPEVYELMKQEIERINSMLPPGTRLRKYVNLHKEFDPEEGELTRTRKLRRTFLEERYRPLIEAIYSDKTEVPVKASIRHRDGRTGTVTTTLHVASVDPNAAISNPGRGTSNPCNCGFLENLRP